MVIMECTVGKVNSFFFVYDIVAIVICFSLVLLYILSQFSHDYKSNFLFLYFRQFVPFISATSSSYLRSSMIYFRLISIAPIEITGTATIPRRNINLCPASAVWINLSACTITFSEVSSPIPAFISNPDIF